MADREYFTPSELSELLGVSEKTLANWRVAGKGPIFHRFGNKIRYRKEEVGAWRSENRHASTQEYMKPEPPVDPLPKAEVRAGIVEQIIALVRQLDVLDSAPDAASPRRTAMPAKRPRGRPRKHP